MMTLAIPAPIPADVLGSLVPAGLFALWSVLVVAIVVGLCAAVLGAEARRYAGRAPITLAPRGGAAGELNAV